MKLQETIEKIRPLDENAMECARKHWDSIAHPLHSLGKLEDMVVPAEDFAVRKEERP